MLFNSLAYAIFLPIVFILYWVIPHKARWILLLIASYYFYMSWNAKYVVLILFTTGVSYFAALMLEKTSKTNIKKLILAVALIACLGVLFFFKYLGFISESIAAVFNIFSIQMHPVLLNLLLPVGISFYTFQTLSYVIDVYKGEVPAEHHFGYYATFISFFPQLVAGPIERTQNLLPQIKARHEFDYDRATYGIKLMAWGYFKKILIADVFAKYVGNVFDAPQNYTGFALILATMCFTIQIYCDFSGYSDIAIGTAKLLGIDLMTNFKSPYFSQSIKEFWSRWHISLSTWFRDYIYIPMGGNRVSKLRHVLNLMVTFLVSGLWHGANWTFVVWGGLHGLGQIFESILLPKNRSNSVSKGFTGLLRTLAVFLFVSFAWLFFVSHSISDAIYVIHNMFIGIGSPISYLYDGFVLFEMDRWTLLREFTFILVMGIYDYFSLRKDVISEIGKKKLAVRWFIYLCLGLILVFYSQKGAPAEFVYFQF